MAPSGVFRIDHDEAFNQTTHLQYQTPWKRIAPWIGFNWRFDSGLVAGAVPCYGIGPGNDCPQSTMLNGMPAIEMTDALGIPLTADQEFQAGFTCNGVHATPTTAAAVYLSGIAVRLHPDPGSIAGNRERRSQSAAHRHRNLFDLAIGDDNLFKGDSYRWSAQLTAINLANNYALYNFLSTFSGTHYVTPRALTAQIGFHF